MLLGITDKERLAINASLFSGIYRFGCEVLVIHTVFER